MRSGSELVSSHQLRLVMPLNRRFAGGRSSVRGEKRIACCSISCQIPSVHRSRVDKFEVRTGNDPHIKKATGPRSQAQKTAESATAHSLSFAVKHPRKSPSCQKEEELKPGFPVICVLVLRITPF
jgi:hypothetical protein